MGIHKSPIKPKLVSASQVENNYLVLPEHTNSLGNIFGGTVMSWIDITAAIAAYKHCRTLVVTASMDHLTFLHPVRLGDLVNLKASVNFASKRSIEVGVRVESENPLTGERQHTSSAYLTFVSLGDEGHAKEVPPLIAKSKAELRRMKDGQKRYQYRKSLRQK